MPTTSGATGRLDAGAGANTTWTINGLKRNTKSNRNCDSYLQLYQEQKMRNKTNVLPNMQENTALTVHGESEVAKEEILQANSGTEDHTLGQTSREERSKKSRLCVIL